VRRAIYALALSALVSGSHAARAESRTPGLAVGVAPHLMLVLTGSCERGSDVVACTPLIPFAGGDLSLSYQVLPLLGLGARLALSKDLDASEGAASGGLVFDPEDQRLWRTAAELRLSPLPGARGLWLSLSGGWARLRESSETISAMNLVVSDSISSNAPLVGLGLGYDAWLGKSFKLAPELRGDFIFFSDPPELRRDETGRDYGTSFWLELALRLSYVF